jgi:hypothetical protein
MHFNCWFVSIRTQIRATCCVSFCLSNLFCCNSPSATFVYQWKCVGEPRPLLTYSVPAPSKATASSWPVHSVALLCAPRFLAVSSGGSARFCSYLAEFFLRISMLVVVAVTVGVGSHSSVTDFPCTFPILSSLFVLGVAK